MKFLFSILISSLIPFTLAHGAEPLNPKTDVIFTPKIPANCYDGLMHKKLHAVNNLTTTETDKEIVVNFRTYVLDCGYNQAREMTATFYGPFHADRCDQSIVPYAGVRVMSFIEPLAPSAPYDKINICNVTVNFDKQYLQAKGVTEYEYKYRYGALIEYPWRVEVVWNAVTNTYAINMAQQQDKVVQPVNHNLDRVGTRRDCDEVTYQMFKRQGLKFWTFESPVAKVNGSNLNISFYVLGVACMEDQLQEFGRPYIWGRSKLPSGQAVVIRNSAHSPVQYDWNSFRYPLGSESLDSHYVVFNVPLMEVMEDDQIALYKKGEVAQVRFKVYVGTTANDNGRADFSELILNLDPNAP